MRRYSSAGKQTSEAKSRSYLVVIGTPLKILGVTDEAVWEFSVI